MKPRRYISDTTLCHLEKEMKPADRIQIAGMLDRIGTSEIVIGTDSLYELGAYRDSVRRATLAVSTGMDPDILARAVALGAPAIHLEIPASYSLIYTVYKKNKDWVKKMLSECAQILADAQLPVTVGLVDASRAELVYLETLAAYVSSMNIARLCVKDSMGLQPLSSCTELINAVKHFGCDVGYEGGDQLGMAVSNTIQALKSGAAYASSRLSGIGCGCDMNNLLRTAGRLFSFDIDRKGVEEIERTFRNLHGY